MMKCFETLLSISTCAATTCAYAALIGNLEMLQWAREHGCPWDRHTRGQAAPEVLWWLDENGAP
jgi:hypothetical protein